MLAERPPSPGPYQMAAQGRVPIERSQTNRRSVASKNWVQAHLVSFWPSSLLLLQQFPMECAWIRKAVSSKT